MSDYPILNYVRCQWCGGNAGSPSHTCTAEGQAKAMESAQEAVNRMMGAPNAKPSSLTKAQLEQRLMECEEALRTVEQAGEDALTNLGNDVLRFAPSDFDDDVAQEEIVIRYVRWLERMAVNSRADIVFTPDDGDDERLQELHDILEVSTDE